MYSGERKNKHREDKALAKGGGGEIEAGGCWPWHNESYLLASDSVRDRDRVQTLDTSCSAS